MCSTFIYIHSSLALIFLKPHICNSPPPAPELTTFRYGRSNDRPASYSRFGWDPHRPRTALIGGMLVEY